MRRVLATVALALLAGSALAQSVTPLTPSGSGTVTSVTCGGATITTSGNCGALTGDVTASAGSGATTLANIPAISGVNLTNLNASNVASGTLAAARGGAGAISGALKANGSGLVTQAACADLSNGATGCSTTVGTAATANTGTSGHVLGFLDGANTLSAAQTINQNAVAPPTVITGAGLQVVGADSVVGRVQATSFGAIAAFTAARADGTGAAPTQVLSGEQVGGVNGYGYGTGAWQGPIYSFRGYAGENIDSTHFGSKACIATTAVASTTLTDNLCIGPDGRASFLAGAITISGNLSAAAWTSTGLVFREAAATLTDTSSSGTVALNYVNLFDTPTLAASSATTYTTAYDVVFTAPTAGANVILTNNFAVLARGGINVTGGGGTGSSGQIITSGLAQFASATFQVNTSDAVTMERQALLGWTSAASNSSATVDTPVCRLSAGVVEFGTGSTCSTTGAVKASAYLAGGSAPTLTGTCTTGTQLGGNTAGSFVATCISQTVIFTFATTAANGWVCTLHDLTTPADALNQTAYSTTTCTVSGTTVASDLVTFEARAF